MIKWIIIGIVLCMLVYFGYIGYCLFQLKKFDDDETLECYYDENGSEGIN